MVCPYTNPAWTPLFQRAIAVVVDSGGSGSHAAIVAREYGIPAVMGTGTATAVLADGRWVTVDGDAGLVVEADAADRPNEPGHWRRGRQWPGAAVRTLVVTPGRTSRSPARSPTS